MSETSAAWLLTAALVCCAAGLAWLALAMESHWTQVRGAQPLVAGMQRLLRALGGGALALSLALCLWADHASMAVLVWVMALAAGALAVAFTLSWRPAWLGFLVAWLPR